MKKGILNFLAGALALLAATAQAGGVSRVFLSPTCNVNLALADLQAREVESPGPLSDGHIPWPKLMGRWQDGSRDLLIRVSEEKNSRYSYLKVTFSSICSGNIIGVGAKTIDTKIPETEYVSVLMHMRDGEEEWVRVTLTPTARGDKMSVIITQPLSYPASAPECQVLDSFQARKL